MGPDELVQIGYVAERHYRGGRSRVELAEELGVSRFKIARMLSKAAELGIVHIDITLPDSIDAQLSNELKRTFGLKRAIAVRTPSQDPAAVQDALGRIAAQLLPEVVKDGDLIGIASGRTLFAATKYLTPLPHADLVSLCGISNPNAEYSSQVILKIADATGGKAWPIFAPFILPDPRTAHALRDEPRIKAAFDLFDRVTLGLVVIGSWDPPDSQFRDLAASFGLADDLLARGAVGEVCSTVFDRDGTVIHGIEDHTLSIPDEQLQQIPEVIAVAGGWRKTDAVLGTLRAGFVTSLVTDSELARRIIAIEKGSDR